VRDSGFNGIEGVLQFRFDILHARYSTSFLVVFKACAPPVRSALGVSAHRQ
jgi:hypothetical protein